MAEKLKVPEFSQEAEEAQWRFNHRDEVAKPFKEAAREGKLRTGSVASLARQKNAAGGITPTTTIRLDPGDISRARTLAAKRGLRYQTYLKMLVDEALAAEEKKLVG